MAGLTFSRRATIILGSSASAPRDRRCLASYDPAASDPLEPSPEAQSARRSSLRAQMQDRRGPAIARRGTRAHSPAGDQPARSSSRAGNRPRASPDLLEASATGYARLRRPFDVARIAMEEGEFYLPDQRHAVNYITYLVNRVLSTGRVHFEFEVAVGTAPLAADRTAPTRSAVSDVPPAPSNPLASGYHRREGPADRTSEDRTGRGPLGYRSSRPAALGRQRSWSRDEGQVPPLIRTERRRRFPSGLQMRSAQSHIGPQPVPIWHTPRFGANERTGGRAHERRRTSLN